MARRSDLEVFARTHGIRIGTIADLIQYRLLHEKTVERAGECEMPSQFGNFRLVAYQDRTSGMVHLALVMGRITPQQPTLVRVHVQDSLCDLTASRREGCGWPLPETMRRVAAEGRGVIVILRQQESSEEMLRRVRAYQARDRGEDLPRRESGTDLRTYGLGAQILCDLGVRKMRVMSAPKRMHAISGFDLQVVEYVTE
jgi:3,4-dihydroxy 2-butanone 4-phosphate synthase/GTP cyclohydrolase II